MTEFSRRDFLRRATQAGAAFAVAAPSLELLLRASASAATLNATDAETLARYADPERMQQLAALGKGVQWRLLGPFRGGRVDAVSGVVGRPNEFYFGAVAGGVWKTIDAGRVWEPVFDAMPIASIGALAVAPSAPDTVYVGSGESTLRDSASFGNGMYKSTDAGKTWTHIGLDGTQHIGKIAVHPTNPNVVYVAAIGHQYAANPERGVFRTTDGGKSWKKVLFRNDDVGAVEVVVDPSNPRVIYAGLWNTRRPPWFIYAPTNGPGGGIWKSTDGGDTWKQLTNGLPPEGIGRTGIAVAPSNPRRVYAVVDCLLPEPNAPAPAPAANGRTVPPPMQGGVFRSDDAGATWRRLSNDQSLWGRGWYFEKIAVDPKDPDVVYVPNVAISRTRDGGKTWDVIRGSPGGDDYHQIWINPNDTNTLIVASDQGAVITHNAKAPDAGTVTWSSWLNQPTAQLYHISVDYRFPYWVTGAQQDTGAVAVRSRGKFGEISMRDWEPSGAGGESGYTAGDPLHPGIIYGGMGDRHDLATNTPIPGTTSPTAPSAQEHLRADWTQPLVLSQADPHALYYGAQFLFKSSDEAKSWTRISPDLTRDNPGVPPNLDAAAAADIDPAGNGRRGVIYTIAPSPISAPMLWVGTDDGNIQRTTDDGKSWQNVTPSQLTPWSRVTMIEASRFDPNVAYASVDRHQLQDFAPYIYRTRDGGKSWQLITRGLPATGYAHTVKEDPKRQGFLVAGTELGAFASMDDGDSWQPLQLNLPVTSVRDFQFHDNDLIVGTFGRGIWVIDDISPLRQLNANVLASDAYLFKPADAINYVQGGDEGTPFQKDEAQAENPADGAYIYYYLKNPASGPVTLEILDASGKTIATQSSDASAMATGRRRNASAGIPRVSPQWQTTPEPLSAAAGIHRAVWEPIASVTPGGDGFRRAVARLSGQFTARLTANGRSYTQQFLVKADPRAVTE